MLNVKVVLTVPSTIHSRPAPTETAVWVEKAMRVFAVLFGGVTVTNGRGAWMSSQTRQLIVEDVTLICSFTDKETIKIELEKVERLAAEIRTAMQQEVVALELGGILYLIDEAAPAIRIAA